MIKRLSLFTVLALFAGLSFLSAQNFMENNFQRQGREYERQAQEAMNEGEYVLAAELAELAQIEYRKSREYADTQILRFQAANAITLAQSAIEGVERTPRAKSFLQEVAQAKALLQEARDLFAAEKWVESRAKAQESLAVIQKIQGLEMIVEDPTAKTGGALPRFYVVVARPRNHDCYWNIAKMPEVYGNPYLWPRLYAANRAKMRNPENPDLIYPGMVMEIPPLRNEKREGTYQPGKVYPKLPE